MNEVVIEQVLAGAAMVLAAIGLVAVRMVTLSRDARASIHEVERPNLPFKDLPEALSRSPARLPGIEDAPRVTGYTGTTAHVATPRAPRLSRLAEADPAFSELDFLDFVEALYVWAHGLRPRRDALGLSAWLAEPARDTFLSGTAGLDSVQDVRVGGLRPVRVYVDDEWCSVEVEVQASMVERVGDLTQRVYRTESWRFRRRSQVRSPARALLLSLGCVSCGSTEPIGEHGACVDCGELRSGPGIQWEVAAIGNMRRNPQVSPPQGLPLGPPGYPAPPEPGLEERQALWEARHPALTGAALVTALEGWLRRALSLEGPTLAGPLGRRLAWEAHLLAEARITRKVSAGKIRFVEFIHFSADATHAFVEARLELDVLLFVDDGRTLPPTTPPLRRVELTLALPLDGGEPLPVDLRWNSDEDDESSF